MSDLIFIFNLEPWFSKFDYKYTYFMVKCQWYRCRL